MTLNVGEYKIYNFVSNITRTLNSTCRALYDLFHVVLSHGIRGSEITTSTQPYKAAVFGEKLKIRGELFAETEWVRRASFFDYEIQSLCYFLL